METLTEIKNKYISKETVSEAIYHTMYDAIASGVLSPGSRILEVEITEQLNVSRTPVREAIQRLVADGVVTYTSHGSTCVKKFSLKEITDIIQAMEALRIISTKEVADSVNKVTLNRIRDILDKIGLLPEQYPDLKEQAHKRYQLDEQFHKIICEATENSYLISFYEKLYKLLAIILRTTEFSNLAYAYREEANEEREEIYQALREHNGEKALELAVKHSQMVYDRLNLLLK